MTSSLSVVTRKCASRRSHPSRQSSDASPLRGTFRSDDAGRGRRSRSRAEC
jgi:hypothetical protein